MALTVTDAIVLHAFDYLETSRILRIATRDAGVQSVIAKGARRNRAKYGSAVDLFSQGEAQLYLKPGRELHTLAAFDVTRARTALALDMDRFLAASALAELILRIGRDDSNPELYDVIVWTLTALESAAGARIPETGLAGAWRAVAASGFAPSLDVCASCHAPLDPSATVAFSHPSGGALCDRCARLAPSARRLPAEARQLLRRWMAAIGNAEIDEAPHASDTTSEILAPIPLETADLRAHLRLLREFLREHVAEERTGRAFLAWEKGISQTD
jgi:DNA repair protein RecO (recombination protein O)